MVKTIIFDFGGVLGSDADDWDTHFKVIQQLTGLTSKQLDEILNKYWPELKTGKESVNAFWLEVAKKSKKKVNPKHLAQTYISKVSINQEVLGMAQQLKNQGFKLVILSNESREWMDAKIKKLPRDLFDKIYCSAYLGMAKPSAEIFTYVLKDLEAQPSEVILVDNQENNIEAAKGLGIKGILYRNPTLLATSLFDLLEERQS